MIGRCIPYKNSPFFGGHVSFQGCKYNPLDFGYDFIWSFFGSYVLGARYQVESTKAAAREPRHSAGVESPEVWMFHVGVFMLEWKITSIWQGGFVCFIDIKY